MLLIASGKFEDTSQQNPIHVSMRFGIDGRGITVDEAAVRKAAATGHTWRNPIWRHDDGSFAEW